MSNEMTTETTVTVTATKCRCGCGCKQSNWSATSDYCRDCNAGDCPGTCRCGTYGRLDDDDRCAACARKAACPACNGWGGFGARLMVRCEPCGGTGNRPEYDE